MAKLVIRRSLVPPRSLVEVELTEEAVSEHDPEDTTSEMFDVGHSYGIHPHAGY